MGYPDDQVVRPAEDQALSEAELARVRLSLEMVRLRAEIAELTAERDTAESRHAEAEREINATWLALEDTPENLQVAAPFVACAHPEDRMASAAALLAALRNHVTKMAIALARADEGPTFAKLREALRACLDEMKAEGVWPGWADRAEDLLRVEQAGPGTIP